jgi:5'-nucleotidase
VCNIDVTNEPTMAGLYTNSVKIERSGKTIGVIGVILSTTYVSPKRFARSLKFYNCQLLQQIASTRDLIFLDEVESITAEAQKLRSENVDMIIVLSHCGIEVDRRIARETGDLVDVIVGGHSHTFLFTGNDPPGPDRPQDEYPIVVKNNEHTVLIVQASAYTKYLGDIVVYFDEVGEIDSWDGAPIYLDSSVVPDPDIVREMEPWHAELEAEQNRIVGRSNVFLSTFGCSSDECNIGSLITDAFVDAYIDYARSLEDWTYATIAMTNVGGIRTSLNRGSLVFGDLVAAIPFENTLNIIDLKGDKLLEALEFGASESWEEDYFRGKAFLQHSGMKVVYNVTNPPFERVIEAKALCRTCEEPTYEDIQADRVYRVILPSFLNGGGDGFDVFRDFGYNKM